MQDPRYKHEYLDNVHSLLTVTGENGDESDKHVDEKKNVMSIVWKLTLLHHIHLLHN